MFEANKNKYVFKLFGGLSVTQTSQKPEFQRRVLGIY